MNRTKIGRLAAGWRAGALGLGLAFGMAVSADAASLITFSGSQTYGSYFELGAFGAAYGAEADLLSPVTVDFSISVLDTPDDLPAYPGGVRAKHTAVSFSVSVDGVEVISDAMSGASGYAQVARFDAGSTDSFFLAVTRIGDFFSPAGDERLGFIYGFVAPKFTFGDPIALPTDAAFHATPAPFNSASNEYFVDSADTTESSAALRYGPMQGGPVTVTVRPVSAVPEPSAWATMLLGFGAMGVLARRRATRVAASA